MRPARPVRHGDPADLARNQSQPTAMEGAAEGNWHRYVTIPAKFEHGRFLAGEGKGGMKSSRAATGMDDQIAVALCGVGRRKANTKRLRQLGTPLVDIDEGCLDAGETAAEECDKRADCTGADNRNPVCRPGGYIP